MAAAVSTNTRRSRPPVSVTRLRVAEQDGATTLALSLASVRAAHRLDVIALCDLDGTLLCSAGDRVAAEELAPFAARAASQPRGRRAEVLPRVGVIVETIEHGGRCWVLAATTTVPARDVHAIVASLRDALPGIAAAASKTEEEDDEDFETALDRAFGESWDDDPLGELGSIIG